MHVLSLLRSLSLITEIISSHTREDAVMSALRLAANIQQNKEERCRIQDEHERVQNRSLI